MSSLLHRSRRYLACLAVLTPLVAATAARAAVEVPSVGGDAPIVMQTASSGGPHNPCGQRVIEHPFTQWNDTADYFLNRQGDVSGGATDWDLGTGEIVAENNPFSLHADETASVGLTEGDAAVAPMVCVGIDTPTMRFFVRNPGAATGTLKVDVLYEDDSYTMHSLPIATLTSADAGDAWTPGPIVDLIAPLVPIFVDGETPVWFQFTAEGEGSHWLVDDVYVDPYGKG